MFLPRFYNYSGTHPDSFGYFQDFITLLVLARILLVLFQILSLFWYSFDLSSGACSDLINFIVLAQIFLLIFNILLHFRYFPRTILWYFPRLNQLFFSLPDSSVPSLDSIILLLLPETILAI